MIADPDPYRFPPFKGNQSDFWNDLEIQDRGQNPEHFLREHGLRPLWKVHLWRLLFQKSVTIDLHLDRCVITSFLLTCTLMKT